MIQRKFAIAIALTALCLVIGVVLLAQGPGPGQTGAPHPNGDWVALRLSNLVKPRA
jgi:hypothetical protein